MRVIPICALALIAVGRDAHAAGEKKAVEKVIKLQVEQLVGEDGPKPELYGASPRFTTSVPDDGMLDLAGLRTSLEKWVSYWGYVAGADVKDLKVVVAPGDADAWASFRVAVDMQEDEMGDAPASFELRVTELLEKADDGWKVIAGHWSRAVADKAAKSRAARGALGTLAGLADADQDDGPGFIEMFRAGPVADLVSARADVAVYGTDATKPRLGGKKTQKAWKKWWKQVTVEGGAVSGASEDGIAGWMVANLAIHKGDVAIPARAFFVLAMEAGVPRIVAAQISVPTPKP